MDTKKLDKWADLLLDTGKRNNLINFKDTRASTVEVLLPSSDVLFEKVDGTASFEVFDPKIVEEDGDSEESCAPEQLQMEMFMRSIQKMFHGTVCLLTTMEMLLLIFQMAQA